MPNPLRALFGQRRDVQMDDPVLMAWLGAVQSSSGVNVDARVALTQGVVLACLIVRAEIMSTLAPSCDVKRKDGDLRLTVPNDPVARALSVSPNDAMTASEFWRWESVTEDLHGNAYARWQRKGNKVEVWPLYKSKPRLMNSGGTLFYRYDGDDFTPAGDYPAKDILHFKGPIMASPFEGKSLIDATRDTIGVAIGSQEFFARMLNNGNHFPAYLETDSTLKAEDVKAISEQMKGFGGLLQAGVMRIFDRGLKVKQNQMTMKDADLSTFLRFVNERLSAIWRVPLPIINDLTHGTYTNSEQADLWLAKHTAQPMCTNKEQVIRQKMLFGDDYLKFNLSAMMRGDFQARTTGYMNLITSGIATRNECRALEDWNPLPGLDDPTLPLNTATVDEDGKVHNHNDDPLAPVADDTRARIRQRFERDGDTERSREFAEMVARPLGDSYRAIGRDFDLQAFIEEARDGA